MFIMENLLMTLVDDSLTNFLAFDGDIQNRLSGLSDNLKDLLNKNYFR